MRSLKIFPVIILLTLIISSCGRKGSETTTTNSDKTETPLSAPDVSDAEKGDWIIQQELADAEKLNPIVSNDATATEITGYMFDKLLPVNRETYKLEPSIAKEQPVISDDHLTYTFDLKENVHFSDNHPLTGEDVVFTFKVIMNPFTDATSTRGYFEDLKNVELVDGNKFKVRFTMSKPYYGAVYAIGDITILPKHILDKDNVNDKFTFADFKDASKQAAGGKGFSDMQTFANFMNSQEVSRDTKYVVGSGPYRLESWVTGQAVTLVRNENYWNKDNVPQYPNKLIYRTIQDQTAALTATKNGEIDNFNMIREIDFVENLKNPDEFKLKKALVSRPTYTYIAWNQQRPFFKDKNVRLALSHLVDRKTIIDKIMYGMGVPIQSHIYYKSKDLKKDLPAIEYDVEKAKQLLDAAGWKDSDGDGTRDKMVDGKKVDFKFTFINNQNPKRKQIMLIVIESLKKVGISADIQDYEWSVFLDKQSKHDYDACYGAWVLGDAPADPYQIFHSSQANSEGSNYISYNNPESDKIIEQLRTEFDEAKRTELYTKWQQIIYDDQPYTFLWTDIAKYVHSNRFKNTRWYAHPYPNMANEWWSSSKDQKYKN